MIWITLLVENSVYGPGLLAEHGLAFHIHAGSRNLLFDTGQSDLLVNNARQLGLDLHDLEAVALSHGHYDHTGGRPAVRALAPQARLLLHPDALAPKYAGNPDGTSRSIGMPDATLRLLNPRATFTETRAATEVIPGIFVTGEIPRVTPFEDVGGPFFLDEACRQPDPLVDDQALFFDTPEGVVVLLGCGHAGVVNTLLHVEKLTGGRRIQAVLGGFHLLQASPERLALTTEALRNRDLQTLVPAHCTGPGAIARLWAAFPDRISKGGVGSRFRF